MEPEKSFTTWTFDNACKDMEQNVLHKAEISVVADLATIDDSDLVIFGIFGSKSKTNDKSVPDPILSGTIKEWDDRYGAALSNLMTENYKSFKHGATVASASPILRIIPEGAKAKKIALVGLGSGDEDLEGTSLAKVGSAIATKCDEAKAKKCSIVFSFDISSAPVADLVAEFYNSLYSDNRYRTGENIKKKAEDLESVTIITEGNSSGAIATGKAIASGVTLAKDIVNAPHNVLNSESLANVARRIAEESDGTIKCTILGKEECEKRGMGAYLGVARGSETEPQFIHLTYSPKDGKVNKKVGIIGKGLLFDTGGYNIKTAMMELMKFDCGGSAAVLGAAKIISEQKPEGVEAHFIVAACENMVNDRAMVPSDILTASNGKTIEVLNTDAEGRLTMADALVYADKEVGCESIIELSTLTGACMVALGKSICGVWTNDDDLAAELADSSKVTGDKSWRMPMETAYNQQLKSLIADIKNVGTRFGGAITAALFLQNFVDENKPFAHIDIAGPVWDDKSGATGFGAKMVTNWVTKQGS